MPFLNKRRAAHINSLINFKHNLIIASSFSIGKTLRNYL